MRSSSSDTVNYLFGPGFHFMETLGLSRVLSVFLCAEMSDGQDIQIALYGAAGCKDQGRSTGSCPRDRA